MSYNKLYKNIQFIRIIEVRFKGNVDNACLSNSQWSRLWKSSGENRNHFFIVYSSGTNDLEHRLMNTGDNVETWELFLLGDSKPYSKIWLHILIMSPGWFWTNDLLRSPWFQGIHILLLTPLPIGSALVDSFNYYTVLHVQGMSSKDSYAPEFWIMLRDYNPQSFIYAVTE